MSLKTRLAKLEENHAAWVEQQMRYAGDNPRLQYIAMLKDTTYLHKNRNVPHGVSIDPEEAYQAMMGKTRVPHEH